MLLLVRLVKGHLSRTDEVFLDLLDACLCLEQLQLRLVLLLKELGVTMLILSACILSYLHARIKR